MIGADKVDASPLASSAIIPVMIGAEDQAIEAAASLRAQGLFIPAIRYPTVARGQARLRLTLTATHTAQEISSVAGAVTKLWPQAEGSSPLS